MINDNGKDRILIVEDEEFCISSLKTLLDQVGINIQDRLDICFTGSEAVNLVIQASERGCNYKLIFTDFSMPVMDGIESTRIITTHLKR